jgi:hypothetical protein
MFNALLEPKKERLLKWSLMFMKDLLCDDDSGGGMVDDGGGDVRW